MAASIERGFWVDIGWIQSRYRDLQRKYPNMYIAVKDRKVVAFGREFGKVYDDAKSKFESEDFAIEYIFSGEPVVIEANLSVC